MQKEFFRYGWLLAFAVVMSITSVSAFAEESHHDKTKGEATTLEMNISPDGRSIVDQNGKEVARFKDDMRVKPAKSGLTKMQGCMCCEKVCLIYDKDGNCIKKVNSCTWDFDCSCK